MIPRRRRILGVSAALAVMIAAAAAMRQAEPPAYTFRVTLGLKDKEPADWDGRVTVAGGEVTALTGWRFEDLRKEYNLAARKLDKAAAKRIVHPNLAARKKSQLARLLREKEAAAKSAPAPAPQA